VIEASESTVSYSRAALHAALAEPHRLAIVDALALGDLSPGELSDRTGQPSNLLAHHLGVLESAGAVTRRRSDHDGRRAYLSLTWENPVVAATAAASVAPAGSRVVFVCAANSARSQIAASLLAARGVTPVASAGTEPAASIHPLAVAELARHGLQPLAPAPASAVEVLAPGDVVVAVCDHAYEVLGRGQVDVHWSVADPSLGVPGAGTAADFERAFADLSPRVDRLARSLTDSPSH
jgi:protein-tyrosine-phosphatase/DNA-binding transcriptional ArsR family regulator